MLLLLGLVSIVILEVILNSLANLLLHLILLTKPPFVYSYHLLFDPISHDMGATALPSLVAVFLSGMFVGYSAKRSGWVYATLAGNAI